MATQENSKISVNHNSLYGSYEHIFYSLNSTFTLSHKNNYTCKVPSKQIANWLPLVILTREDLKLDLLLYLVIRYRKSILANDAVPQLSSSLVCTQFQKPSTMLHCSLPQEKLKVPFRNTVMSTAPVLYCQS